MSKPEQKRRYSSPRRKEQALATREKLLEVARRLFASRLKDDLLVAESLGGKNELRPDLTVDQARDLLWALGSAEMYRMLIVDRGWSPDHYEQWLAEALTDALLGHDEPNA